MEREGIVIKYLLSKSINIIAVNLFIGVLVTLCISNLVSAFQMVGKPADKLSHNYSAISIGFDMDKITKKNLKLTDLKNELDKSNDSITLMKTNDRLITGVYLNHGGFTPDIISGRGFTNDDFHNGTNTILISESLISSCTDINGKKYYPLENQYYEVIGTYKKSTNKVNLDSNAYYNLGSKNVLEFSNFIVGSYLVDAGSSTKEVVQKIDDFCSIIVSYVSGDNSFIDNLEKAFSTQIASITSILLIIMMVILNSVSISANWLENRKKEIFIRKMTGGYPSKINRMLIRDFWIVLSISFVLSVVMAVIVSKINLRIFVGFDFSILTLVVAYLFVVLIGTITVGVILISYNRKSGIAKMVRC